MISIMDLTGCSIEVTDLDEAIRISGEYRQYRHEDESFSEFDKRMKAYWSDMHDKLKAIKEQVTNIKF